MNSFVEINQNIEENQKDDMNYMKLQKLDKQESRNSYGIYQ